MSYLNKISIIIPAYNEEKRIGLTIEGLIKTFTQSGWNREDWEIIIVDDGSTDTTSAIVAGYIKQHSSLKSIHHFHNMGKGQALRRGVAEAQGDSIVIYDADSATPPAMILKYVPLLTEGAYDIIIGSRELGFRMGYDVTYSVSRRIAGRIFAFITNRIVPGYLDTQCGFKLFKKEAGCHLFSLLRQKQFTWDVELLALAKQFNYKVHEVPVDWHHQTESKVHLFRDSLRMTRQLFQIRRRIQRIGHEQWFHDSKCPICGSIYWNKIKTYQSWTISKCGVCGFGSLTPKPNSQELSSLYDQDYFMKGDTTVGYNDYLLWEKCIKKTAIKRLEILENWIRPPGKLLEIGCATGYFLEIARERGWDVKGIEISPWATKVAQQNIGLERIIHAPAEEAFSTLAHEKFHVIVAWDVIEHVLEPAKMITRLRNLLLPEGLLAITTPNTEGLLARLTGASWLNYNKVPEHVHFFGKTNFCQLLDQLNFSLLYAKNHGKHAPIGFIINRMLQILKMNAQFLERNTFFNRAGVYCNPTDVLLVIGKVKGSRL